MFEIIYIYDYIYVAGSLLCLNIIFMMFLFLAQVYGPDLSHVYISNTCLNYIQMFL